MKRLIAEIKRWDTYCFIFVSFNTNFYFTLLDPAAEKIFNYSTLQLDCLEIRLKQQNPGQFCSGRTAGYLSVVQADSLKTKLEKKKLFTSGKSEVSLSQYLWTGWHWPLPESPPRRPPARRWICPRWKARCSLNIQNRSDWRNMCAQKGFIQAFCVYVIHPNVSQDDI